MTIEDLNKAIEIASMLDNINNIKLPSKISDINLVRSDGISTKWDGSIKVDSACSFYIEGGSDEFNRYSICINNINLTANESTKLVDTVKNILTERKIVFDKEFEEM